MDSESLFISDIHLSPARPQVTRCFLAFLEQRATSAQSLYILGDLFDYWVGDDDCSAPRQQIIKSLKQLSNSGVEVFLLHGNRDFLIADQFAQQTGIRLLEDCTTINLYQHSVLLMHGDLLCTDDHQYQQFRQLSRTDEWQRKVMSKPLWLRSSLARWYRIKSALHKNKQSVEIMDVNQQTILKYAQQYQSNILIHGHTHRPGYSETPAENTAIQRYVLGEWQHSAILLSVTAQAFNLEEITLVDKVLKSTVIKK
jgi:UDP-2,3-diacylglucosamine hydrolase